MTRPLTIALVAPYPPAGERHGGHSGVASYTANLAHGLTSLGHSVDVVAQRCEGDPERYDDGPVRVHRAFTLGTGALPEAARAVATLDADLIHLQWELFLYGGPRSVAGLVPALASFHRRSAPLVTTMHQVVDPVMVDVRYTRMHRISTPASVARAGISAVQRAVQWSSAAVVVHEEAFRRILPAATVIPHGIEIVEPIDRGAARTELDLDDRFVVMCFGFLAPYKGLEAALHTARLLGPTLQLVIAGGEHPRMSGEAGYGTELRSLYEDTARFTGRVADADVARWFAAADLALFPYPKPFSSSGALALALAHGTPTLMSAALARCAGAPSVLSASMDPPVLADRLEHLATKPAALDELRQWTAILASGRQWPAVAARHVDLYREVLDVNRHSPWRLRAG